MTSHEPTSAAHRERLYAAPPKPEPPLAPPKRNPLAKPQPPRRPRRRIRVEGAKTPAEQALAKKLTTTQALSADERALLREMRALNPNAAGIVLRKLKEKK